MLVHQETGRDYKVSILFNYILQNVDDFFFQLSKSSRCYSPLDSSYTCHKRRGL